MTQARPKPVRPATLPGAGTLFALRAIGVVLLARGLFSMSQMQAVLATSESGADYPSDIQRILNFFATLANVLSSPWVCVHLVFLFLLIVLPGARSRAERPFHPLPQWLRQALRLLALLTLAFALWSIGAFVWRAGARGAWAALVQSNGWLAATPALYAAVIWVCRPRALWRTHIAAQRFALGRYAVALDAATRTAVIWTESYKLGQYDTRELSVRWLHGDAAMASTAPVVPAPDAATAAGAPGASDAPPQTSGALTSAIARSSAKPARHVHHAHRPKVELLWNPPVAVGHNRQTVFSASLVSDKDLVAARALDAALRRV